MTSLSSLLYDFSYLMKSIEENNGEIPDNLLPVLSKTEIDIAHKIDKYVGFCDVVKAQIDRTKRNIEDFKHTLESLENLEKRLKENVKHTMQLYELITINGTSRTIKLVNSGGVQSTQKPDDMFFSVDCIAEKYLDEVKEFVEERKIFVIKDKEKFKEAVRDNKIKSCFLLPRGKYVKFV